METTSHTGPVPVTVVEDDEVLNDEGFRSVYDVPFIIVNEIDGELVAEIQVSDNELVTEARVQEAREAARREGQREYFMSVGDKEYPELAGIDHGLITLYFAPFADGDL